MLEPGGDQGAVVERRGGGRRMETEMRIGLVWRVSWVVERRWVGGWTGEQGEKGIGKK